MESHRAHGANRHTQVVWNTTYYMENVTRVVRHKNALQHIFTSNRRLDVVTATAKKELKPTEPNRTIDERRKK